jgi:iron complex outermembrane receptor protein
VGRNRIGDYQDLQPNSKINAQVNFDKGALALMLRVNRFGEVTSLHSSDPTQDQTLSAKVLTDMEVAYRLGGGLRFSVGANNLLDVYPDKSFKSSSFNGIFPYSGASPFGFSGRFVYTRLTYHL